MTSLAPGLTTPEKIGNTLIGVIFWISAWQLANDLTINIPRKKRIAIFTVITIIAILFMAYFSYRSDKTSVNQPSLINSDQSSDSSN